MHMDCKVSGFKFQVVSLLACAAGLAALPTRADAGWSSGGGEIIKYERNPWWKSYTEEERVEYCIAIDEKNFGLGRDRARWRIRKSLDFWSRELARTTLNGFRGTTFHEAACGPQTRLRFQLGTLDESQRRLLLNPEAHVGHAVMTAYDPALQRGAGFIYVAPESGPWGLNRDPLNAPNVWKMRSGEVLQAVLQHEIGHTFGIGHSSPEEWGNLMHEWFPTLAISDFYAPTFKRGSAGNFQVMKASIPPGWSDALSICETSEIGSAFISKTGMAAPLKILWPSSSNGVQDTVQQGSGLAEALGVVPGKKSTCFQFTEWKDKLEIRYSADPKEGDPDMPLIHSVPLQEILVRQELLSQVTRRTSSSFGGQGTAAREVSELLGKGKGFSVFVTRTPLSSRTGGRIVIESGGRAWEFGGSYFPRPH